MDNNNRTRDSRRSSSTANAFPPRRHPTISLRRSSQEGEVELQETVRLRGKRERDRDREPSKRRRGSHSHSTEEESVGNDQDGDVVDAGVSRLLSSSTASSAPDQTHRRSVRPTPPPPPPPSTNNITREIIGVTVPRKARSACVKRTHESWVSATLEEQSLQSGEAASPSSSVVSLKKMKWTGPKTRLPKESKSCSSTQEDIEIEIAELLYGLKTSKNNQSSSSQKRGPSTSPTSLHSSDAEKKKVEDHSSSALATNVSDQSAKVEKLSTESAKVLAYGVVDNASGHRIGPSEAAKEDNDLNSGAGCGVTLDGRSEFFPGESPSCSKSKLDVDKHEDSASTRDVSAVPEDKGHRIDKFEIDLMAPPPMMLSPERDSLSGGEDGVTVENKAEKLIKKEKTKEDIEEVKMDVLKLDLEKPNKHNDKGNNNKLEEQGRNKEQLTKSTNPKVEKTGQSSSVPLSTLVPEWPNSLCPLGYVPPLQTVVKTDKTTGLSTTRKHVNFVLSQPRAKRCATHHYIAHNIFLNKQCANMNSFLPSAVGSGSPCDTRHNNINRMPSAESIIAGKQSHKHSPGVNQNAAQVEGWAATSDSSLAVVRSSANPIDSTQMKQLVLQQGPHPGSTGNLMHGPAFPFPSGQPQASVTTTTIQAGVVNSTSSASSSNKTHSSAAGSLGSSSTLPAVAAMNFSYPNLAATDTPYMTIVQNNGYPFPFSTPLGASVAIRGASPAQATPILNGPLYSSQMFHPLQHPQQHLHSQALVQPFYLNASTSSGSSSHKQSQGTQVNGNSILTSTAMQLQQSQKQHTSQSNPRKQETGVAGGNAPSVASGTAYSQKNVYGQNFTIPVQPLNLSFRPSGTSDSVGSTSGNFGDNKQQPQALKGGVERIPSQAFAISFAAFNGTSVPSNLNFSSMAQNPVIFQSLPDIAWQGYQAASASHTAQQKIYSITEGKSGGKSSHQQDDEKKATSGKPSSNGPTTLVFDNSSKNLNFVSSPMNGNWPSRSITSTSTTTSLPLSGIASNSQQPPQLLHLQQQHGVLQQQPAMATQYKASTSVTSAAKIVNSPAVFTQTLNQCKSSNQASQSKNSGRTPDSQVHNTSIITSTTPAVKSFPPEQGRVLQGHTQISFGGNYIPSLPPQGQQVLNNNQPFGTTVAGASPNGGNLKTNSQGSKLVSSVNTSQAQQTENSSAGTGQKSSPVCGRNIPSILSSCPSHLSELKY